jgi:hypothetical protein
VPGPHWRAVEPEVLELRQLTQDAARPHHSRKRDSPLDKVKST